MSHPTRSSTTGLLARVRTAPPDPIRSLGRVARADPRVGKLNLGVGVLLDRESRSSVFLSVREAARRAGNTPLAARYLPSEGNPDFLHQVRALFFPRSRAPVSGFQTLGGTGALSLAARLLVHASPSARVCVPELTWSNHPAIFEAAGAEVRTYPYLGPDGRVMGEALVSALDRLGPNDAVVLHGCCHNPTGLDPDPDTWEAVAEAATRRGFLPILDYAYVGLGRGLEADLEPLRRLERRQVPLLVAASMSKILGLYGERVGALLIGGPHASSDLGSRLARLARVDYSTPPRFGAAVAAEVLADGGLRWQWKLELEEARQRLSRIREALARHLELRAPRRFSAVARGLGLFAWTGIDRGAVSSLAQQRGFYLPANGRLNLGAVPAARVDEVAEALVEALTLEEALTPEKRAR